jgi:hypothetical protein
MGRVKKSSRGSQVAGVPPSLRACSLISLRPKQSRKPTSKAGPEGVLVHLLLDDERGVAHVGEEDPTHHLADDHLDVLVVDDHALGPVDLLNLCTAGISRSQSVFAIF